ncbi:kelch domain-containing protein 7A [Emydura macquarii macquarii]|uniref:kelch domain-containing protein 7A n=1 Tax=Emydura macquarii macquarii TaxID=1129001 RepID=UPI003529D9C1
MTPEAGVSQGWTSDMQLAGKLALSAAALLLVTWAYRVYKSRPATSLQGRGIIKADAGNATGQRENAARDGAGRGGAEMPQGLRYRQVTSEVKQSAHLGGTVVAGTQGLQSTPPRKDQSLRNGEEEEEKEKGKEENQLVSESPPDKKQPVSEGEGQSPGVILRAELVATADGAEQGVTGTAAGGKQNTCGLNLSLDESRGARQDIASLHSELCLSKHTPFSHQPGNAPELPAANRASPDTEKQEEAGDMSESLAWKQEAQAGQERIQTIHATSDMGLAINQSEKSDASYTFSSIAQIQVEENYIKERQPREEKPGQATSSATSLRGKVYDYYVQSTSQSVSKQRPRSYIRSFHDPDKANEELRDNETWLHTSQHPEPTGESAAGDEDRASPTANAPPNSPSLPPFKHPAESWEPADWGGASDPGRSFSPARQTAEPECSFGRKESFHQIADNPELQVQMEGFGALTPPGRRADSSTSLDSPPKSGSIIPLVELMHSLQADASNKPSVELVAGANFFKVPLSFQSAMDIHLDLGNCYDALCLAKKQKLESLKEAAYKVMSDNYLQVLKNPSIYGRLNALERELILLRRMKGRKYITVADVSTQERSFHTSRLCYYDDEGDVWHPLTHMPVEVVSRGCAVCSMFNYLFVVAGCEGLGRLQKSSNRVFCYNPLTNIWQEICPLNQARPHCKLVALDGYLYAIGGECLYTVERYDPRQDRWTFTAPLPNDTFAVAHTATVCDGEIYVTGGTLRYMLLRYVSRSDSWKVSLTGGSKDRTTEMVTVGGFIYRFDLNRSMGISVYRCSAKAKLWYECATHRTPYPACFQCAVVNNLVYCVSRQFNIRFLADHVSPRFGVKELQVFPSPTGTLFPFVLVLPDRDTVQTRV